MTVLAALDSEFAHYRVYRIGERDWMFLASPDRPVPDLHPEPMEEWPLLAKELGTLGIHDIGMLDTLAVADERLLRPYLKGKPANRDAFPLLDNGAEKARFFRLSAESLNKLRFIPLPLAEVMSGLTRRPYPAEGVPRTWEKHHLMWEADRANWLLEAFRERDREASDATAMKVYLEQSEKLAGTKDQPEAWRAWYFAVFNVFSETAPWVSLESEPWWKEVLVTAADPACPAGVVDGVELIDAVIHRDAERLERVSGRLIEDHSDLVADEFLALSHALALEMREAPAEDRRAFVDRHMATLANGKTSLDVAFQIVRAHLAR
jgi:hypothetical protein